MINVKMEGEKFIKLKDLKGGGFFITSEAQIENPRVFMKSDFLGTVEETSKEIITNRPPSTIRCLDLEVQGCYNLDADCLIVPIKFKEAVIEKDYDRLGA